MGKNFYVIMDGELHPFSCNKIYTEMDALVAYTNTEEHALELASMYEHGEIETTSIQCDKCGKIHEVLQEKEE